MGEIPRKLCEGKEVKRVEAECCPDHIHMLLEIVCRASWVIRWLRPEYQTKSKEERKAIQVTLDIGLPLEPSAKGRKGKTTKGTVEPKAAWPADLLEQTQAVRGVVTTLQDAGTAITPDSVAEHFTRAPRARVQEILQVLEALGFV